METRSNYVLVGAVVIALTVAMFAFVLYLAKFSRGDKNEYDIFYRSSISGLAIGSPVQFKGVPVGQIKEIALLPRSPDAVRVRIEIKADTPILHGTTAAIEGVGFTGVSQIQLTGAMAGATPIVEPGPFGVPVIPAARRRARPAARQRAGAAQQRLGADRVLERAAQPGEPQVARQHPRQHRPPDRQPRRPRAGDRRDARRDARDAQAGDRRRRRADAADQRTPTRC